jgi:hypothetical protein
MEMTMKLDDFIAETLTEIVNGVQKAQKDCTGTNAVIAPQGQLRKMQMVAFDVALTVEKGTQTKGGIGVLSGVVNLGSAGQSENTQTAINKIKFEVPIILPHGQPLEY